VARKTPSRVRPAPRKAAAQQGPLTATEFRLVDARGRVRAVLSSGRAGPSLAMLHEDGELALEVTVGTTGPTIKLVDDRGSTRLFLGSTRGGARMGMTDLTGTQRLFIGVNPAGTPDVALYDEHQQRVWRPGTRTAHKSETVKSPARKSNRA
jgi:hypothetical protein